MNKKLLTLLLLATPVLLHAQATLDLASRAQLRRSRLALLSPETKDFSQVEIKDGVARLKKSMGVPATHVFAVAKLKEGYTENDLKAEGVNVVRCHLGFAFLSIPLDDVERVAQVKAIKTLQVAREGKTYNRQARELSGINLIHQGVGLDKTYTGKDVICGIFDTGIDPNHVNFKDKDGNLRVKYVSNITLNASTGEVSEKYYNNPTSISKFTTDNTETFHGTHTLGTMAGSYTGSITMAGNGGETTEENCQYYGAAYDADIVAICGTINEYIIALGVQEMLGYQLMMNKPMVINISAGTQLGPHDGSSLLCQFFDACVDQYNAKICLAGGNSGDQKIVVNKTFTADNTVMQSFIEGYEVQGNSGAMVYARDGILYAYSNSTEPFDIQAIIYNKKRGTISKRFPLTITDDNMLTGKYWISSSAYQGGDTDIIDETFAKYMEGYVGLLWGYTDNEDRMYAAIDFCCIDNSTNNSNHDYALGFIINGKEGQTINVYGDGSLSYFTNNDIEGWDDGSFDGTISDWCTAKGVLSVGAYNSASTAALLNGEDYTVYGYNFEEGNVTPFSSYGSLNDGRTLPDVLAPGAVVVSSMNRYYTPTEGSVYTEVGKTADGHYWGADVGTSMSSPLVAGAIALWLEADSTLTMHDIKEIIKTTAVNDDQLAQYPSAQVGAGKFDAYAGLKEVIKRLSSGIDEVTMNKGQLLLTPTGNRSFKVCQTGCNNLNISMFNLSGQEVMHTNVNGEETIIHAEALPKGCYIVQVNGKRSKCVLK